jgi:hypothetical protein
MYFEVDTRTEGVLAKGVGKLSINKESVSLTNVYSVREVGQETMIPRPVLVFSHPQTSPMLVPPPQRCLVQSLRPPQGDYSRSRRSFNVTCALAKKGRKLSASELEVRRIMGEGSYGQVFEASLPFRWRQFFLTV